MASQTKTKVSKKDLEQKRAAVEAAIRKKGECEKKALEIVEFLVEIKVTTSNWLVENSKFISPQYYDDVTEERAITKVCGFPLCPNILTKVENKKFAISTKTNKVYDITERKKFCSDKCFSSSRIFKDQLPTSPLWMRDEEKFAEIEIPSKLKSMPGDEVLVTSIVLPDDEKEDEDKSAQRQEIEARKLEQKKKEIQERGTALMLHPCDVVFKSLRQWFCTKTLDWLENSGDLSDDEEIDELNQRLSGLKVNKSCKKQPPAKYNSAVSYKALKHDEKHAELKVRAFFSGQWEYACDEEEQLATVKEVTNEPDPDVVEVPIVMPLANLSAQRALRRKVVLDYLEKWLLGFSTATNLTFRQYQHDLHDLVSTFSLTADTITFRPDEIPVLGVAVLLMLGRKNVAVHEYLIDPQLLEKIAKILRPYDRSLSDMGDFLDDLVENCKK